MNQPQISPSKKISYTILMVLIPILFLVMLELLLRLIGYGDSYPLVKIEKRFGKEKYLINTQVARRYFSLPSELTPEAADESFDIKKRPNGLRIICIGGSTTAGFPYEINATFPFQLQYRLRDALLDNYVEVINLGISAVNSFTFLDLLPEILDLQPDLLLIYMGHNEFYGAYGVGSSQGIMKNRSLILLYLKLRKFRLVQLVQVAINSISSLFGPEKSLPSQSLMQTLAGDHTIYRDSEKFKTAGQYFEKNLSEIVSQARERGVLVLVSNLVANYKDQKPFVSKFSNSLNDLTRRQCEQLLLIARSHQETGDHEKALQIFSELAAIDSLSADLHFYQARSFYNLGDTLKAFQHFSKARDLDLLRFRAPGIFNDIIRRVAQRHNVPMVNMQKIFCKASLGGIPGVQFFHEHLHPNFDGYRLMAQAFYEALYTIQFSNPLNEVGFKENLLSEEQIQKLIKIFPEDSAGVTALDIEFGRMRNFFLTHRWPFSESPVDLNLFQPFGSEITRDLAYRHLKKEIYWDDAHYQLAEHYIRQNQFNKSWLEYRAVNLSFYDHYLPFSKIGDLFFSQEQFPKAITWYQKAVNRREDDPLLLSKLGNAQTLANRFKSAIKTYKKVFAVDNGLLAAEQKTTIFYLIAVSQANLKHWQEAEDAIKNCLSINPDFQPALQLKAKIQQYRAGRK